MNYLAHAYLSFDSPTVLVGNMISDFVKGKKKYEFDEAIQNGIMLHRSIDDFTDNHETTKEAKQVFKSTVGLYAGAFTDVAYDHFLANDPNEFTEASLKTFAQRTYATLSNYRHVFPPRFAGMFPYMQQHDWLYNYRTNWGIERSFEGLVRRATYLHDSPGAFDAFTANYSTLRDCYEQFFPALKKFVEGIFATFKL
ncbi:ACP phosphodiesterase [Danxiaibacter flavus]|uniref:ACP phosphodiesterase n=1 Tax=Danxiaibacter flavus TaxID=3049108 RepID=A0ABV3ZKT0_9BACT|nr:ACP phosphodiesterase [Chitinophagaceae bacterium DXS]